ncbi:hypothetical protein LOSG293_070260 [Secundilactobacillus oryzae JCM 18671]|uniref:Stage II sporulation protein M n=1 Tax=Secundilactobacillus oryzae JCM 18671 TaxID=1291743 RepID=A0A081BHG9_9LACO|nr:stage II sporulation protein M [Secundilactobacillus oryzae]GAK47487.1 hypothetical protein LOSG293_070260 [Secundilactobacillus oryzae JCM 18671]
MTIIKESLRRFKTFYLKRFIRYLLVMIAASIVLTVGMRLTMGHESALEMAQRLVNLKVGEKLSFLPLFLHNYSADLIIIALGIVPVPIYILFVLQQTISVGAVLASAAHPWITFVLGILPHGIFEVSSQLIAVAISARLMWTVYDGLFRHDRYKTEASLWQVIYESVIDALVLALPLIFVAGLIETYITPLLLRLIVK